MKNSVGQAVRGKDFWKRVNELAAIWSAIESGSHILLVAPRRVGKTSIMFNLQDEPKDGYVVVYIDTESADSENEFWQKLFNALLEDEFVSKLKKYTTRFGNFLEGISIDKITTKGVEFGDGTVVDYATAFENLIKELDSDKKLIIMLDEFAQTVENIIKYEDEKNAQKFLRTHRALRQNENLSHKVIFVYAGSIGLESVVTKMNASKLINDLNSIKVKPLTRDEGVLFTQQLCKATSIEMSDETITILLDKIEWLIPFYIQLLIQQLDILSREQNQTQIDEVMINGAIEQALSQRQLFDHWRSKLKDGFKKKGYLFAKEILNIICQEDTMSSLKIRNKATKHELDEDYAREIIHSLEYDGYITKYEDDKTYRFNSPILKLWWYKNVAN
jgi:hypothetical protein